MIFVSQQARGPCPESVTRRPKLQKHVTCYPDLNRLRCTTCPDHCPEDRSTSYRKTVLMSDCSYVGLSRFLPSFQKSSLIHQILQMKGLAFVACEAMQR